MFQSIWVAIALEAVKRLTSSDFINSVKEIVISYINDDIKGEEKRNLAFQRIKSLGFDFSAWVINMSIEIVYGYLKIKYPNLFIKENINGNTRN